MRSSLSAFGLTAFSLTAFALNCVRANCVRANCVCLVNLSCAGTPLGQCPGSRRHPRAHMYNCVTSRSAMLRRRTTELRCRDVGQSPEALVCANTCSRLYGQMGQSSKQLRAAFFVLLVMCASLQTITASQTLFAVTTASACAESLPYGMSSSSSWDGSTAFLCVDCDTTAHDSWSQV